MNLFIAPILFNTRGKFRKKEINEDYIIKTKLDVIEFSEDNEEYSEEPSVH